MQGTQDRSQSELSLGAASLFSASHHDGCLDGVEQLFDLFLYDFRQSRPS